MLNMRIVGKLRIYDALSARLEGYHGHLEEGRS